MAKEYPVSEPTEAERWLLKWHRTFEEPRADFSAFTRHEKNRASQFRC